VPDKYAVIGNPIAHSKSPQIHTAFARQTGQDIVYEERILAPLDGFTNTIKRLIAEGYAGCNVTVPFKFEAYSLATRRAELAQSAQAANTLTFDGAEIVGDNTDGKGLVADITRNLGFDLQGKKVLLMGAGGAAYGVASPLQQAGAQLYIANRSEGKAIQLATSIGAIGGSYDAAGKQPFDVIINATSSGLSDQLPPIPANVFASGCLAYDMMYGRETPFMQFAREHGARVTDGLGMLVEQAAEAFFIWRGVRPDTASVITQLRSA
jgi:shikimate dehydrogenase